MSYTTTYRVELPSKHVTEGNTERTKGRGRQRKQLLKTFKDENDRKRKHQLAIAGELDLEEAVDLSKDRLLNE